MQIGAHFFELLQIGLCDIVAGGGVFHSHFKIIGFHIFARVKKIWGHILKKGFFYLNPVCFCVI